MGLFIVTACVPDGLELGALGSTCLFAVWGTSHLLSKPALTGSGSEVEVLSSARYSAYSSMLTLDAGIEFCTSRGYRSIFSTKGTSS